MERQLIDAIRQSAHLLGGAKRDHDPLLRMARDARIVLLGEPTHGTHDTYRERARITQRLVAELGFTGVVWEADWPDAERAGRWARGLSDDADAEEALEGFERFPTWMWRNSVVLDFLGFDAVIHLDHTRAVEPLERSARWHDVEPPETYPSAL